MAEEVKSMQRQESTTSLYLRNFIFGVEDSLVSTVGLLSGIAAVGVARSTIFITGVILIFVEAFSMAVGSFLSEHSADEYLSEKGAVLRPTIIAALIMFFSYFVAGFIPLTPYVVTEVGSALGISIGLSLLALFVLGAGSAHMFGARVVRNGLKMLIVGGIAVIVGVVVGGIAQQFLPGTI